MTKNIVSISQGRAATIAGFGILIMTLFFIFADIMVFKNLIVQGDATNTANNIIANEMQFRIGIFSILVVLICDVIVAWALYIFLKLVNNGLSLLTAWFRLVYAAMLGVAMSYLIIGLAHLSGADYLTILGTNRLHAQVLLFLNAFYDVWAIGLIVFGFHLLILGFLVLKSEFIPKVMGILLMVAGFSYLIDYIAKLIYPNFNFGISLLFGWGELIFMFWLLFKGSKIREA